ncbi:START domain-containing protein [Adhaeribacter aquaticus]|uniref:START domain-containing protein n=1 Tax=Adhaeribacter aquaticus TaxID=299567 RepID=UPI000424F084|nr:START domain-containing protein [Adhaeribacter aquaticus]
MNKIKAVFLGLFALGICLSGYAQEKWELRKDENGIRVYSRKLQGNGFKELKVLCELPGTTQKLMGVLKDVDNQKNWVYSVRSSHVLKKKSENNIIYYTQADMPWPISDRDFVTELTFEEDPVTKKLHIESRGLPGFLGPKPGYVRVPDALAIWEVTPVAGDRLQVEYTFRVNPGGSLPAWLVNLASSTGPYYTFQNLREILQNKK